ncbi:MAG: General transcription factor II-I repeat domain-containing protein 2-like [Marteilia pararefringens]
MATQQSSLLNFAKRKEVNDEELSASPMRKKRLSKDEVRQYREEWNLRYFTLKLDETKYLCLICNQELSSMKE